MVKQFFSRIGSKANGQAFVELVLVVLILALMLAGVVEFGYLLNSYLKVIDGSREGARFSSRSLPFEVGNEEFSNQVFYTQTVTQAMRVMAPITLNGNLGDDIVVSVFSVGQGGGTIRRWPIGYDSGWNLCNNHTDGALVGVLNVENWSSCTPRNSHFSTDQIQSLTQTSAPLPSGILLVEVFYNYPQILKLPVFSSVIPDPILIYTYSVMPLSAAEPTKSP
jgi:hypothetical protein